MYAISGGVRSRNTSFKNTTTSAKILNLVVNVKDGAVESLEWKNECIDKICAPEGPQCNHYSTTFNKITYHESNCFTSDSNCTGSSCDTKVFVTWRGTDADGLYLYSDNYRITNLVDYSIQTYYENASNLPLN